MRSYPDFFFNDTAPPEIYTLSLHDALPIYFADLAAISDAFTITKKLIVAIAQCIAARAAAIDRKSPRLNSSHQNISYAVFCLKKKKGKQ